MKATEILRKEHRAIEYLLAAVEIQARRLPAGGPVRIPFFTEAAVFFREFVEDCHQRKEEDMLLVAVIDAGQPRGSGPVAEALAQHAGEQALLREIEKHARTAQGGGEAGRAALSRCAAEFVSLLTRHIRLEEDTLFPLAERAIPADVQNELDGHFDRIERGYVEAGLHDTYYGLAEKLAEEASG